MGEHFLVDISVRMNMNQEISRPFPSRKIILLALFGPFTDQDGTFLYPFIYPKPEKRYPCRVEPPGIGHYRDYPPPSATIQSTTKSVFILQITSHYRLLFQP